MQDAPTQPPTSAAIESTPVPAPAPAAWNTGASIALGAMCIGLLLVVYGLRRWAAMKAGQPTAKPKSAKATAAQVEAKPGRATTSAENVKALRQDMEELTERLAGMLDAKAQRIEKLLEEADGTIRALERAQAKVETARPRPAPERQTVVEEEQLPPTQKRILELHAAGLNPVQIAQRTGEPTGQVELVINLRRAALRR